MDDMLTNFVNKIITLAPPNIINRNGVDYFDKVMHQEERLKPNALQFRTLNGLIDYITRSNDIPMDKVDDLLIHVISHDVVTLISKIQDPFKDRITYVQCNSTMPVFGFGHWTDIESFIICMQSMFIQDENTASILKIIGNIKHEAITTHTDDGVTQTVAAKTGLTTLAQVDIPNPVELRPYRTFLEIHQHESKFVFRIRSTEGRGIECALFEADAGKWKIDAVRNICDWIKCQLKDTEFDIPILS